MDELKPCPLCGWCDGNHKPISADNQTTPTQPTADNKTEPPKKNGWVVTQKTCGAFTGFDTLPEAPEGSE